MSWVDKIHHLYYIAYTNYKRNVTFLAECNKINNFFFFCQVLNRASKVTITIGVAVSYDSYTEPSLTR